MRLFSISALLFFTLCFVGNAQTINVEALRKHTGKQRFVLEGNLNFNYINNNGIYFYQLGAGVGTQIKTKSLNDVFLVVGSLSLSRSEDQDFANNWFFHARYNREIDNVFRIEAFVQSQHDEILDVNARNLAGAGIRLKLISREYKNDTDHGIRLYFGAAYMYEIEKNDAFDIRNFDHRHSSYLSFTADIPKTILSVTNTLYYQPLYSDLDDYRILNQLRWSIPISQKINFNTSFNYYIDSVTPANRKQYSSSLFFGFSVDLASSIKSEDAYKQIG